MCSSMMSGARWILGGKNDAAVECLRFLVGRGDEVLALANVGDDGRDTWQRSFAGEARRLGVHLEIPERINDPGVMDRLAAFRATALISVQYDQILRPNLLRAIGCPCLNLHFALLPRHRGVFPIAWAIISGDTEAGVTLHHMIEDIDAGDVIAQRAVRIGADETARELYDELSEAAVALFRECYPFPSKLLATRQSQDPSVDSYHRRGEFDFSNCTIDWDQPARDLHRWIRAMIFPPFQYPQTRLNGHTYSVTRVAGPVGEPAEACPGVVVERSADFVDVATADGRIRIREIVDGAHPRTELMTSIVPGNRFV